MFGEMKVRSCLLCQLVYLVLIVLVQGRPESSNKPDTKWIDVGTNTLFYVEKTETDWKNASQICAAMGKEHLGHPGRLADFASRDEMYLLDGYLAKIEGGVWIGLHRDDTGSFVWTGQRSPTFFNWGRAEPNNIHNDEDCVEIVASSMRWNDGSCNLKHPFICALNKVLVPETTTTSTAPETTGKDSNTTSVQPTAPTSRDSEWIDIGTGTVFYFEKRMRASWNDSSHRCDEIGKKHWGHPARLANFSSISEMFLLDSYLAEIGGNLWIGLHRGDTGSFVWTDQQSPTFFNWGRGEPNDRHNDEDCVEIVSSSLRWNDGSCNWKRSFICALDKDRTIVPPVTSKTSTVAGTLKIEPNTTVTVSPQRTVKTVLMAGDTEWIDVGTKTVFYFEKRRRSNWTDASERCVKMGKKLWGHPARLADFASRNEMFLLDSYLAEIGGSPWIGLYRDDTGSFVWTEKRSPTFFNWGRGEPNNDGNNENCGEIKASSLRWNDGCCILKRFFICALDKVWTSAGLITTTTTAPETTTDSTTIVTPVLSPNPEPHGTEESTPSVGGNLTYCGPELKEWILLNNNCFLVRAAQGNELNWISAKEYCVGRKAQLVSELDESEKDYIYSGMLTKSQSKHVLWSALKLSGEVSDSEWIAGVQVNHTKFGHEAISERCLSYNLQCGKLKDLLCSTKLGFICKTAFQPQNTTAQNIEETRIYRKN